MSDKTDADLWTESWQDYLTGRGVITQVKPVAPLSADATATLQARVERAEARLESAHAEMDRQMQSGFSMGAKLIDAEAQLAAVRAVLNRIKWKSADKDNMEFSARITCYLMDDIRALASRDTGPLAHCTCDGNGPDGTGHLPDCGYWRVKGAEG